MLSVQFSSIQLNFLYIYCQITTKSSQGASHMPVHTSSNNSAVVSSIFFPSSTIDCQNGLWQPSGLLKCFWGKKTLQHYIWCHRITTNQQEVVEIPMVKYGDGSIMTLSTFACVLWIWLELKQFFKSGPKFLLDIVQVLRLFLTMLQSVKT